MSNFGHKLETSHSFLKQRSAYYDVLQKHRAGSREIIEENQVYKNYLNVILFILIFFLGSRNENFIRRTSI